VRTAAVYAYVTLTEYLFGDFLENWLIGCTHCPIPLNIHVPAVLMCLMPLTQDGGFLSNTVMPIVFRRFRPFRKHPLE